MDHEEAMTRLLDAAERLYYEKGVHAVGMDEVRAASGVSLKRLYQCFASKTHLVEAYLRRRDARWRESMATYVRRHAARADEGPLAVFDWLAEWFATPGFRGCAFTNSFGELGSSSEAVAKAVRDHKEAVRRYLLDIVGDLGADNPRSVADQLFLLVEGAMAAAAVDGGPGPARTAKTAARTLIASAAPAAAPAH